MAELVNAQFRQPFAAYWGDGTTSSSDGQNFKAGVRGQFAGQINLKYGQKPGVQFYTHISNQYAPFHTKVINATVRDAAHVLDDLLYHESDLRIDEHYTDTAGFTDHVFALMHLLGCSGRHHPVEHSLPGAGNKGVTGEWQGHRRKASIAPLAAGLGTHQSYRRYIWRQNELVEQDKLQPLRMLDEA
jgi:hypothetical protein